MNLKTCTNLVFTLSYLGEKYIKDSGFWLKCGLLAIDAKNSSLMIRHLIISAGIYSHLGQTLIAEGMYRQALETLKTDKTIENRYNLSLALFLYGKLLSRNKQRIDEAQRYIKDSENVLFFEWYEDLVSLHYFDFAFE